VRNVGDSGLAADGCQEAGGEEIRWPLRLLHQEQLHPLPVAAQYGVRATVECCLRARKLCSSCRGAVGHVLTPQHTKCRSTVALSRSFTLAKERRGVGRSGRTPGWRRRCQAHAHDRHAYLLVKFWRLCARWKRGTGAAATSGASSEGKDASGAKSIGNSYK
jgi:hypothetical protein